MDDGRAITVSAATTLEAAVTLMTEYGFHHLPVVEDERQAARRAQMRTKIGLGF